MKQYKEVEATRIQYHKNPTMNSVHRASLMVPELPDTHASISFLNHFLLKRKYPNVACKITPIDVHGKKVESCLYNIDKPIVYTIPLTKMADTQISNYLIEFFAAENLFIPYPAVMINHHGNGFINQVHSFNRILNDIFEDDSINKTQVKEASVDVVLDNKTDTFLLFTAGPLHCNAPLEVEITTLEKTYKKTLNMVLPRFGIEKISIKNTFHEIPNGVKGILKAKQPQQLLFYGRILTGQCTSDGAFSANHSYYDSSTAPEYWNDNRPSQRFYPFFSNLDNIIRMYPIMSPSNLMLSISLYAKDGSQLAEKQFGDLTSPDNRFLNVNVNSLVSEANVISDDVSTFAVTVRASEKMPTRVSHQLVYGAGALNTSINISLHNPNVFVPEGKKSFKWGQAIVGSDYDSFVGIVADSCENPLINTHEANVKFYDDTGEILQKNFSIPNGSAVKLHVNQELKDQLKNTNDVKYIWITIDSEHHGMNFFSVAYNRVTKHCSGDHGF